MESVEIFVCLFDFVLRALDNHFLGGGDCYFDFKIVIGFIMNFLAFWTGKLAIFGFTFGLSSFRVTRIFTIFRLRNP